MNILIWIGSTLLGAGAGAVYVLAIIAFATYVIPPQHMTPPL